MTDVKMPQLPEPGNPEDQWPDKKWDEDEMKAYGLACAEAMRKACAEACEKFARLAILKKPIDCDSYDSGYWLGYSMALEECKDAICALEIGNG